MGEYPLRRESLERLGKWRCLLATELLAPKPVRKAWTGATDVRVRWEVLEAESITQGEGRDEEASAPRSETQGDMERKAREADETGQTGKSKPWESSVMKAEEKLWEGNIIFKKIEPEKMNNAMLLQTLSSTTLPNNVYATRFEEESVLQLSSRNS